MLLQPPQPLGAHQGLAGDLPCAFGHPQGQEAVAPRPWPLHGLQHRPIGEDQSPADQLFVHCLLPLLLAHGPAAPDHRVPGRQVKHPRPLYRQSVEPLSPLLQGEEVQKHLEAQAVPHLRQVKAFTAGLVVHHPEVEPPVLHPAVHPVHEAGDADGNPLRRQLHRRQLPPAPKAQLKGNGPESGGAQLLGHVVHRRLDGAQQAAEQIAEALALGLQPSQFLCRVAVHRRPYRRSQPLLQLLPPALLPDGAALEHMLQHIVDEGAVLRRSESGRLPGLRLEAVAHEVREVAGLVLVHPGGGHGYPLSIQPVHRPPGQPAPLPASGPFQPLHLGGVLRQGPHHPPDCRAPPRQLQGGQGGRHAEGVPQSLLPHLCKAGEEQLQPPHQEAGPPLLPPRPLGGPGENQTPAGQGADLIQGGHLPVEALLRALVQLQAVGGQQGAVVVGEQAGLRPHLGDGAVVRPQQEEHLHPVAGLPGGFPRCHPVQGDRDSAHVILREHQLEQTGELLQLHRHLPGEGGTLLQPAAQDLPELAVLLGQRGLPPPAQFLHPLSQPPGQADLLQKAVESHSLSPSCTGRIFPQPLQRGRHLPPGPVHPLQQGLVLLRHGEAIAPGVHGPGLLLRPPAPPDVPLQDIVLQQIPVLLP